MMKVTLYIAFSLLCGIYMVNSAIFGGKMARISLDRINRKLLAGALYDTSSPLRKVSNISSKKVLTVASYLSIRGGKRENNEDSDGGENDEENEDQDSDTVSSDQSSIMKSTVVSMISEAWKKTPPITQAYVGAAIGLASTFFVFYNNIWPDILHLEWGPVFTKFQIWRPLTAFLYFGPVGLNFILTIQFVWIYMSQLEKLHHSKPEEYLVMLLFGAASLIGSYSILGLPTKFLGHNLSAYLVYIWARMFEGTEVNFMDLFTLKAELLPWFYCLHTLILEGEFPYADVLGIAVGHLYHYLSHQKILYAPSALKEWFSQPAIREKYSKFKEEFE